MIKRLALVGICMISAGLCAPAHADTPSLRDVLLSSGKHFPAISQAKAKRDAAEGEVQEALGAFDFTLNNDTTTRTSGFYDGKQTSSKFVKPLQDFNAKLSAGYRVSDGTFPIYEDYNFTNNGGEFNLEVFLSLLRDRDIDDDRLALWNSRLNAKKAQQELLLAKVSTQNAAMKAYYEWLAASEIYKINTTLLKLAQDRQKALTSRSTEGDVASILLTENNQYLFRREGLMNDAERLLKNAATNLSFYWRNDKGEMLVPSKPGTSLRAPDKTALTEELNPEQLYENRPDIKVIDAEIAKYQNELKAAENRLLPRADVVMRTSRDSGDGSITRRGTDNMIGVSVSIPLQNNTAEGKIAKSKAEIKSLQHERELRRNRILQQLRIVENNLTASKKLMELARKEKDAAKKMQVAEEKIFKNGGSDYFLLNMREENFAMANVKYTTAMLDLHRVLADYYAITIDLKELALASE